MCDGFLRLLRGAVCNFRNSNCVSESVYWPEHFWELEREPRTVIHVKRAKMFDPMG